MRKWITVVLASLFCISAFAGCGKAKPHKFEPTEYKYDVLGLEEISVGLWVTPPKGKITDDNYKVMSEMGINFVNGFGYNESTDDEISSVLDYCEKYKMKFMLNQLTMEKNIKSYESSDKKETLISDAMNALKPYASHPAYAGQLFIDEPGVPMFNSIKPFVSEYKKLYPSKQSYINLFPTYATGGIGASSYEEYIDSWLELMQPEFLSYDSYPLVDYDPASTGYYAELSDYYYNLDLLRNKTREKGIPLWSFISAGTIKNIQGEPNRRVPSREDLRWTVFSNLAFGVKGIQYFCYWTPTQDNFGDMIIGRNGQPTERYGFAKEVNEEFGIYGKYLLNSNADGVILNDERRGGYEIYSSSLNSFGRITEVSGNLALIGCFTDQTDGTKSVLITPTTPRDSTTVTLSISGKTAMEAYINGKKTSLAPEAGKVTLTVVAGDAVYIRL